MAHRAEQIIDAIVSKLTTAGIQRVAKHRLLTYSADLELPAVSVRLGPDSPPTDSPVQNIAFIDSVLTVQIVTIARAPKEPALMTALMDLRRSIHVALMADYTLGLSFVSDTRYAGAGAPDIETTSEGIAGRLESIWTVPYRMSVADPAS